MIKLSTSTIKNFITVAKTVYSSILIYILNHICT